MSSEKSAWDGKKDVVRQGRRKCRSTMLSIYYGILTGQPGVLLSIFYTILAVRPALLLMWDWQMLDHNQLDILIPFLLQVRLKMGFTESRKDFKIPWYYPLDRLLLRLAQREVEISMGDHVLPHQRSLAHITYARVRYAVNYDAGVIQTYVSRACVYEDAIRNENEKTIALRQLVRIWKNTGELFCLTGFKSTGLTYLINALYLAKGEADTKDQVEKIEKMINRWKK